MEVVCPAAVKLRHNLENAEFERFPGYQTISQCLGGVERISFKRIESA